MAVQHLCEEKEKELRNAVENNLLLELLKRNMDTLSSSTVTSSSILSLSSSEIQEQVGYIDKKLQNLLNHVYDVRSECEQLVYSLGLVLCLANNNQSLYHHELNI